MTESSRGQRAGAVVAIMMIAGIVAGIFLLIRAGSAPRDEGLSFAVAGIVTVIATVMGGIRASIALVHPREKQRIPSARVVKDRPSVR